MVATRATRSASRSRPTTSACGPARTARRRPPSRGRCAAAGARRRPGAAPPPPRSRCAGRRGGELPAQQRRWSPPRAADRSPGRRRVTSPDVGQLQLAGVEHLDGEQLVPARTAPAAARSHSRLAEEVGDHHGQPAPARRAAQLLERGREVAARVPPAPAAWSRPARSRCCARAAGRPRAGIRVDRRSPVATTAPIRLPPPRGQVADRGQPRRPPGRASRSRRCRSRGWAERSTTSQVSSSRSATVCRTCGVGGAGGDRPVHPPDVVAGLVRPRLARLGARARAPGRGGCPAAARRAARARSAPARAARPRPGRRAARARSVRGARGTGRRLGGAGRPRAPSWRPGWAAPPGGAVAVTRLIRRRAVRRIDAPAGGGVAGLAAAACWRGATCGSGTVCSTRPMMCVHRDAVGQRVVGQHQPVPQHVRRRRRGRPAAARSRGRASAPARGPAAIEAEAWPAGWRRRTPSRATSGSPCSAGRAGGEHQPHHVVDQRVVHEDVGRHAAAAARARSGSSTCVRRPAGRRPSGRRSRAPRPAPGSPTRILIRNRSRCASGSG